MNQDQVNDMLVVRCRNGVSGVGRLHKGKTKGKERSKNLPKYWLEDLSGSNPCHMMSCTSRDLKQTRLLLQLFIT